MKKSYAIGLIIAIQVAFLMFAFWNLNLKITFLYAAVQAANLIVVFYLIGSRDNPSYQIAWVIVILVFPLFGILLYLVAGNHYLSPRMRRKIEASQKLGKKLRCQIPETLTRLGDFNEICRREAEYILHTTDKPVYTHTQAEYYSTGPEMFKSMLVALEKAEKFIFLEYFIVSEGEMWNRIFEILKKKASEGVEIRLIYDDAGSMDGLSKKFLSKTTRAGIRIARFNPFLPVLNKFMNNRDHRKILVADGNIAFTGGINIADEYIDKKKLHGYWKDGGVAIRGEAVWNFTVMFLDMWAMITGEDLGHERYRPTLKAEGDGFVQPFSDGPLSTYHAAEGIYLRMIHSACRYAYFVTPYLIVDHQLMTALCTAAMSGVDVRIVTPGIPDKWYVHDVTRSNYRRLIESGVKIYEYTPGFIHAKLALCDDLAGMVGSVNLDYRSLYMLFECSVFFCGCSVLKEIKTDFASLFKVSALMDIEAICSWPWYLRLRQRILRLFAPMM